MASVPDKTEPGKAQNRPERLYRGDEKEGSRLFGPLAAAAHAPVLYIGVRMAAEASSDRDAVVAEAGQPADLPGYERHRDRTRNKKRKRYMFRPLQGTDRSRRLNDDGRFVTISSSEKGLPRALEIVAAIAGLALFAPVLALCAVLVKISSRGPVLFRQSRIGYGGSVFTLYKFRTMREAGKGSLITAKGDSRVTLVGRILRKVKLDELPELFNVLTGDMSFVGPRPEVPEYVDFADPVWKTVLGVRPGITDPATLKMRNEEAFLALIEDKDDYYRRVIQPFKLKESMRYLERRSAFGDLRVILRTLKVIIFPGTAPVVPAEEARLTISSP